ncbi:hypothetical protein IAU59_004182 [Kwoniella sp. CBS 9459]
MFVQRPLLAAQRVATRGRRPPPPLRPSPFTLASTQKTSSVNPSSALAESSSSSSGSTTTTTSAPLESESGNETQIQHDEDMGAGRYFVNRSEGGKLPVYSRIRNGGSITTIVRKVDTLQKDLNTYLATLHIDPFTSPPKVTVRPTNQHLQIKGHWVEEVKGWLEGRGF